MSERCFMMFGSPGKRQVRGPHRRDHHAGWLEIESLTWKWSPQGAGAGGGGKSKVTELVCWRRTDALSPLLRVHWMEATWFDLVVLDIWDDAARASKGKLELRSVNIAGFSPSYGQYHRDEITLDFDDLRMSHAGGMTAAITLTPIQMALAKAAK